MELHKVFGGFAENLKHLNSNPPTICDRLAPLEDGV